MISFCFFLFSKFKIHVDVFYWYFNKHVLFFYKYTFRPSVGHYGDKI